VAAGPHSAFLGFSIAAYGVFFYLSLALLFALGSQAGVEARSAAAVLSLLAVGLALVIDVMLLGVQAFAIERYCNLCMITYLVNAALLILLLPARRGAGTPWQTLRLAQGRLAFTGWVIASVASAVALGATDLVLAHRADRRQASVLGTLPAATPSKTLGPPPAADPETTPAGAPAEQSTEEAPEPASTPQTSPSAPASPPAQASPPASRDAELERARAEARRLQGILDDPHRLQEYLDEKAWREYESAPSQQIALEGVPFKGAEQAPIRVVEFSDFLCPFCRSVAMAFNRFVPETRGLVALYFKQYPLDKDCNDRLRSSLHAGACQLALGAVCAGQQGSDAFWSFHDKAFEKRLRKPTLDDVLSVAAEASLDFARLERCMSSGAAREELARHVEDGRRLGVNATPTIFINGKKLPRVNDFVQAINAEAARLGLQPLAASAR
jgi:protein-disulfide isomerase